MHVSEHFADVILEFMSEDCGMGSVDDLIGSGWHIHMLKGLDPGRGYICRVELQGESGSLIVLNSIEGARKADNSILLTYTDGTLALMLRIEG